MAYVVGVMLGAKGITVVLSCGHNRFIGNKDPKSQYECKRHRNHND